MAEYLWSKCICRYQTRCGHCRKTIRKGEVFHHDKLRSDGFCDACRKALDPALPSERLGVPPTTPDVDVKLTELEGAK